MAAVAHELEEKGYVPVFVDGTGIQVSGRCFEHAAKLYTGERGYWLHAVFVGGLWASGRLRPGGDVACGWKGQLKRDVARLLPAGTPVWVHCGERLQGAAGRPRSAPPAVPPLPRQPGIPRLRPDDACCCTPCSSGCYRRPHAATTSAHWCGK